MRKRGFGFSKVDSGSEKLCGDATNEKKRAEEEENKEMIEREREMGFKRKSQDRAAESGGKCSGQSNSALGTAICKTKE